MATKEDDQVNKSHRRALSRFFSVDSDINLTCNIPTTPAYSFYSKDFILKIAELITGIGCVGLYGAAISEKAPPEGFPHHVVFGSYIIITSVIIMSYILGQLMPDVVTRAFLSIGMILYFISATISTTVWCSNENVRNDTAGVRLTQTLPLIQAILSYLNCVLYGADLLFNIKKAVFLEL